MHYMEPVESNIRFRKLIFDTTPTCPGTSMSFIVNSRYFRCDIAMVLKKVEMAPCFIGYKKQPSARWLLLTDLHDKNSEWDNEYASLRNGRG